MFAYVLVGITFYAAAILTTFGPALWEYTHFGPTVGPMVMIIVTSLAGLCETAIGFLMILLLGGRSSLRLTRLMSRITHSKQIVETTKTPMISSIRARMLDRIHWLYMPGLVFISAVGLGWDVHNVNGAKAGLFQPVIPLLDIFSRPTPEMSPIVFSRHLIPALVLLTAIAGIVPALVLPYFDKFKVTGINAGPFHTTLLYSVVGVLAGLGVILTLVGVFYRSLWLNRAPLPYHFGILALLGFSLHYCLGMYLGMKRAEVKILREIHASESGKLIVIA